MRPWERRLRDLSLLLSSCQRTYFSPEQFRLNVNQFLQTSRTVTFIIQKNKADLPNYEVWYNRLIDLWKVDPVMKWAVDSRNTIEKIGDLELYSKLQVALVTSYLEEDDRVLEIESNKHIGDGIGQLHSLVRQSYAHLQGDEWAVKLGRTWVANSLPEFELLKTFDLIYSRQYEMCGEASQSLGETLSKEIIPPSEMASLSLESRHVQYIDGASGRITHFARVKDQPREFGLFGKVELSKQKQRFEAINSFETGFDMMVESAKAHFLRDGYHISILMCFDSAGKPVDAIPFDFRSRATKFIIFREIAERVALTRPSFIVFIAEAWQRQQPKRSDQPFSISALPIVGEVLQIVGMQKTETIREISLPIIRVGEGKPSLGIAKSITEDARRTSFGFLIPIIRAMNERNANA